MTGWRGTTEALTLFKPGQPMVMWVEYYNHQPQCRQVAKGVDPVLEWALVRASQVSGNLSSRTVLLTAP